MSLTRAALQTAARLAAVGVGGLAYASLIERNAFTLRRVIVPVLPSRGRARCASLHLSDIHLVLRQTRKVEWIRSLARLEPDLVVTTGDNLAHLEAVPAVLRAFEPLLAITGVFVLGLQRLLRTEPEEPRAVPDQGARPAWRTFRCRPLILWTPSPAPVGRTSPMLDVAFGRRAAPGARGRR